jgi:2-(1,2-epoxy-1,2-dihydrophenyl)acetyl-CoA isomerase
MTTDLLTHVADAVATITLNRPEKMNAFTDEMLSSFISHLEDYRTRSDVNVVVLTATGRAFCAGGDVGKFDQYASAGAAAIKHRLTENVQALALKIRQIDKPVIAAVNGLAAGGGMDLAMMCDMRFAARSARFAETYAKMGLLPGAGGAYYLPRLVGVARALEMFWSCEWIGAERAEEIGLVNRVFDDEQLQQETLAFARKLARQAPLSVRTIKKILYQGLSTDLPTALELVAANLPVVRLSEDHKEALSAFREKREATFQGR